MVNVNHYEVYVKQVVEGDLWGFIEITGYVWNNRAELVNDTAEEWLKTDFDGVSRGYIPM